MTKCPYCDNIFPAHKHPVIHLMAKGLRNFRIHDQWSADGKFFPGWEVRNGRTTVCGSSATWYKNFNPERVTENVEKVTCMSCLKHKDTSCNNRSDPPLDGGV